MIIEYPKMLYLRGWDDLAAHVTVNDSVEEEAARLEGYKGLGEVDEPAEVVDAPKRRGRPPKAVEQ